MLWALFPLLHAASVGVDARGQLADLEAVNDMARAGAAADLRQEPARVPLPLDGTPADADRAEAADLRYDAVHQELQERLLAARTDALAQSQLHARQAAKAAAAPDSTLPAVDVVVLGAGLSGLVAAKQLQQHELSVVVLEAQDRVGGRILDAPAQKTRRLVFGAGRVEVGGSQIGPMQFQPDAWKLVTELGFTAVGPEGGDAIARGKRVSGQEPYTELLAALDPAARDQVKQAAEVLAAEHKALPEAADTLDVMTFDTWLTEHAPHPEARGFLRMATLDLLSQEPYALSALAVVEALGGQLFARLGPMQGFHVQGGMQSLAQTLAKRIADLRLDSPVRSVTQTDAGVQVVFQSGKKTVSVQCRRLLVAGSFAASNRIAFEPPLPLPKQHLFAHAPMAASFKMLAVYPERFWHEQGLSGLSVSTAEADGVLFPRCWDASADDGSVFALGCLCAGECSVSLMQRSPQERQEVLATALAATFGAKALHPQQYLDHDWEADPFTGGSMPTFPPGVLTRLRDAMTSDFGNVSWAGADFCPGACRGTLDGAIQSGYGAATHLATMLASAAPPPLLDLERPFGGRDAIRRPLDFFNLVIEVVRDALQRTVIGPLTSEKCVHTVFGLGVAMALVAAYLYFPRRVKEWAVPFRDVRAAPSAVAAPAETESLLGPSR